MSNASVSWGRIKEVGEGEGGRKEVGRGRGGEERGEGGGGRGREGEGESAEGDGEGHYNVIYNIDVLFVKVLLLIWHKLVHCSVLVSCV